AALGLVGRQIAGSRRVCEAFVTRSPDEGGARLSPFRGESDSAVGRPPTPQIDNRTRSLEPPVQKNEIQNLAFHEQFLDSRPPLAVGGEKSALQQLQLDEPSAGTEIVVGRLHRAPHATACSRSPRRERPSIGRRSCSSIISRSASRARESLERIVPTGTFRISATSS